MHVSQVSSPALTCPLRNSQRDVYRNLWTIPLFYLERQFLSHTSQIHGTTRAAHKQHTSFDEWFKKTSEYINEYQVWIELYHA